MNRKCEDIIDAKLRDRLADLLPDIEDWTETQCRGYLNERGVEVEDDEDIDDLRELCREEHREDECGGVLSVDRLTTYRICLSWGGPAEYIELVSDGDGWTGGRYIYQDWFDGAERPIDATTAAELADLFGVGPDYE